MIRLLYLNFNWIESVFWLEIVSETDCALETKKAKKQIQNIIWTPKENDYLQARQSYSLLRADEQRKKRNSLSVHLWAREVQGGQD